MLLKEEKPAANVLQFLEFSHTARITVQIVDRCILHRKKDRRMSRNDKLASEKPRRIVDVRTKLDLSADR